jgi:hypothetical protein
MGLLTLLFTPPKLEDVRVKVSIFVTRNKRRRDNGTSRKTFNLTIGSRLIKST